MVRRVPPKSNILQFHRKTNLDGGKVVTETILIVDDEPAVRRTVAEWLREALPHVELHEAKDAESALRLAEQHPIDLAILDWNLGTGDNGLQLLEDLHLFLPDLVAILITGYAGQATPLAALRLGVRDYFDKSQDFSRQALTQAVRRQLDRLRPQKRERQVRAGLERFRDQVTEASRSFAAAAALEQGEPFTEAVGAILESVRQCVSAEVAVLLLRTVSAEGESMEWFVTPGPRPPFSPAVAFSDSLAAAIACQQPTCVSSAVHGNVAVPNELEGRHCHVLGTAWMVDSQTTAVLELLDATESTTSTEFSPLAVRRLGELRPLVGVALRALHSQRTGRALLNAALEQALAMSHALTSEPVPSGFVGESTTPPLPAPAELALAQMIGAVGHRFGPQALEFCRELVGRLEKLLAAQNGRSS